MQLGQVFSDYSRLLSLPAPSTGAIAQLLTRIQTGIKRGGFVDIHNSAQQDLQLQAIQKVLIFSLNSGTGTALKKWHAVFFKPQSQAKARAVADDMEEGLPFFDIRQKVIGSQESLGRAEVLVKSPAEVQEQKFNFLKCGEFAPLLGEVTLPFSLIVSGKPGSGKTTFFMQLIRHICISYPSQRVLFVSNEEGFSPSMAAKLKRFNFGNVRNLAITEDLPRSIDYDFVFVDSVNSLRLDLPQFKALIAKQNARGGAFLAIMQATKQGRFKGASEFEHYPSISLGASGGVIENIKNRFGGAGEFVAYKTLKPTKR